MSAKQPNFCVSTTPAGGGDITPAPVAADFLAEPSPAGTGVVEPPKPVYAPAEAGSDETINEFSF